MLDQWKNRGKDNADNRPAVPQFSESEMRLALKAGLVGLNFKFEPTVAGEEPKQFEITKRELAALTHEIAQVESLVEPYKPGESIIRYLRSLETAIGIYEGNVHALAAILKRPSVTAEVATYQARFAKIDDAIKDRKRTVLGGPLGLFYDQEIVTYSARGERKTRKVKLVTWRDDVFPKGIYVTFEDGENMNALELVNSAQRPTKYAPDSIVPQDVRSYIDYTFINNLNLKKDVQQHGDKYTIQLTSKSGKKWTIDCKIVTNSTNPLGKLALNIERIIDWQALTTAPQLSSFEGQRVTTAQVGSIVKYIETQTELTTEPKGIQKWKQKGMQLFNSAKKRLLGLFN